MLETRLRNTNSNVSLSTDTIITNFTSGSVVFIDSARTLAEDNANFFWDDTNNRLGLGTTSPTDHLEIDKTSPTFYLNNDGGVANDNPIIKWNALSLSEGLRFFSGATQVARIQDGGFIAGLLGVGTFGGDMVLQNYFVRRGTNGPRITFGDAAESGLTLTHATATDSFPIWVLVNSPNAANIQFAVRGAASQSANLTEWQNSAQAILARIDSSGNITTTGTLTFDQATDVVLTASSAALSIGTAAFTCGNLTIGGGASATQTLTANLSGTDVVATFGSASFSIATAAFTCGNITTTGTLTFDQATDVVMTASSAALSIAAAAFTCGALTASTSTTSPIIIGGTGTTSTLSLRSTSGVGAAGADIIFQTGNNGATETMRILNSGFVGIGTPTPVANINSTTARNLDITSSNFANIVLHGSDTVEASIHGGSAGAGLGFSIAGSATASDNFIQFKTGNTNSSYSLTERMRITSAGEVLINTTSAISGVKLHVNVGTNQNLWVRSVSSVTTIEAANDAGSAGVALVIQATDIKLSAASGTITIPDAVNFVLNATTGTKFGTGTTQKLAFYNATPVAQQTGVAVTAAGIHAALVTLGLITA